MKRISEEQRMHLVMRVLILMTVILAILLLPACAAPAPEGAEPSGDLVTSEQPAMSEHQHHAQEPGTLGGLPGHSVYHLASTWWDQTGDSRPLSSLGGRVQLVSMVYTHCAFACPMIVADLKRIESALGPELADEVGFVLVSIDPERDTPERLARFTADLRLDPERWTTLSSDEGNVLELAAVLGVRYVRESESDFGHTNLIAVLSPDGEIVHRQLGLGDGVDATVAAVRELASTL